MTTRLLLVDDHAVLRQSVAHFLSCHGCVREVAEAATAAEAFALVRSQSYDAILLDISLPDMHGIEVLKRLKCKVPHVPVLIFSMYSEKQYAIRALKAGASGYLSKTCDVDEMIAAIRQVVTARKYVSPTMAEALADLVLGDNEKMPHELLSDREFQTLCMLASGKRLTDIANVLSLSVTTVSVYRTRLLEKMKLNNNAELTRYVMNHNLFDLDATRFD